MRLCDSLLRSTPSRRSDRFTSMPLLYLKMHLQDMVDRFFITGRISICTKTTMKIALFLLLMIIRTTRPVITVSYCSFFSLRTATNLAIACDNLYKLSSFQDQNQRLHISVALAQLLSSGPYHSCLRCKNTFPPTLQLIVVTEACN